MQCKVIDTETVTIHCYACSQKELNQQIKTIEQQLTHHTTHKVIKVLIFVVGLALKDYSDTQLALRDHYAHLFTNYSINILMISHLEQFKALVQQIELANGEEYETNYLQLQKISEKALRQSVIHSYVEKKFKWSQVKANYFIDRNKMGSLYDVLRYSGYPQWEKTVAAKTLAFEQFCAKWREEQQAGQNEQEDIYDQ